jgi:hypothetical protein
MTVMSRVLNRVKKTEVYTDELQAILIAQIGTQDSRIFANLNAFGVSDKLVELGVEIDENQIDEVSEHLLAEMKRLEVFQVS